MSSPLISSWFICGNYFIRSSSHFPQLSICFHMYNPSMAHIHVLPIPLCLFWWYWGFNLRLMLAMQLLHSLNYSTSPYPLPVRLNTIIFINSTSLIIISFIIEI
jgi:hypothetical protein